MRRRPCGGICPVADAFVRLGLDPSGVVAGAQAASAGLTPFVRRVQTMPAALRPVAGAVDGLTARYRTLGRVARGAFDEQIAAARRAGSTLQAEGRRAGAAFGTTLAAGVRSRSGAAVQAAARVMSDISAYLPQSGSGARRGPMANLTRSGRAIPEVLAVGVRSGTPTLRAAIAAMTAQARGQLTAGLRPPAGAGAGLATLPAPSRAAPAAPYRGSAGGSGGQFEVLPVTRGGVAALPAPGRGTAVPLAGAAALPAPAGLGGGAAPVITNRAGVPVSAAPAQQAGVVQRAALPPPARLLAGPAVTAPPARLLPAPRVLGAPAPGPLRLRHAGAGVLMSGSTGGRVTPVPGGGYRGAGAGFSGGPYAPPPPGAGGRAPPPPPRGARGARGGRPSRGGGDGGAATGGDTGSLGKLWAFSALGGTVRQVTHGLRRIADEGVERMSDSQVALAELRTVITPAHSFAGMNREQTIAALEHQASLTARNRTPAGRLVGGLGREQVMESYFAAASSGVKGEAIVPVAEQSALLGIAGQTSARQAGIYLTSMFGQWGDQGRIAAAPASRRADVAAQEVRYISDVMARTQDSFATPGGLNELGPAFARVSPIAKAMNYTLEETAVTIGVLADAGFRGALGGNKARMVMDDLDISMQRLGLQTARNADGTRSLEGSLRRIQDAGVGENEIIKAFGKMAAPGLLVMLDSLHKFDAGLKDVAGTTMENASEHAETYKNRLGNYTDALSEFQIHMGEGAGAVRTAGLEVGTTLLSVANALGPGFGQMVGGAAQIGSVVAGRRRRHP